jgi:hypothetical protein
MAAFTVQVLSRLPASEAVHAAAHGMLGLGYVVASYAPGRAHLRFEGSYDPRGHDADRGHIVTVSGTTRGLVFSFEAPSDGFFTYDQFSLLGRRELESRARRAVAAAEASYAPAPPPQHPHVVVERQVLVTRCKYCGHVTPVDLERCAGCGGAKFC